MGSRPDTVETNCKCPDCNKIHCKEILDSCYRNALPNLPVEKCKTCKGNWERQYRAWKLTQEKYLRDVAKQWEKENPFNYIKGEQKSGD